MRILRKRGNIFIWAGVGMIVGPAALNQVRRITGVGLSLPTVGGGG
jgi:hypothetical protein